MSVLRPLGGFVGMLEGLTGKLLARQMILLAVRDGGGAMSVGSKFVEFSSALMRILWHGGMVLGDHTTIEGIGFEDCSIVDSFGRERLRISEGPQKEIRTGAMKRKCG
jgi:hypothetical protein